MLDANTQALKVHEIKEAAAEKLERRVGDLSKEMMRDPGEWQEALREVLAGSDADKALELMAGGDTQKGAELLVILASGYIYSRATDIADDE